MERPQAEKNVCGKTGRERKASCNFPFLIIKLLANSIAYLQKSHAVKSFNLFLQLVNSEKTINEGQII